MIDKPGKYKISFDEYLADPCVEPSLTRSTIKDLIDGTAKKAFLKHPRLNPQAKEKSSEKFDIGTAAHAIFLEGSASTIQVILAADWRTKKAQEKRDAAREAGKIPLLEHQFVEVTAMVVEALSAFSKWEGRQLRTSDGDSEMTYIWQDGLTWCRIRPDWISKDRRLVIDYKTTGQSADPQEYNRIAISTGLDIQDAFYRRGIQAVEGEEPDFVFMVQETEPPYLCAFMSLDMMTKDMGEEKVRYGIREWEKHLRTGQWPGYGNRTFTMEAPPWTLAQWEMRKFTLEGSHED